MPNVQSALVQTSFPICEVKGYTKPSAEQIALLNKFKAHEVALGELVKEAKASRLIDARTLAVGKTQAQTAYMWLNRAVFQPEDF